MYGSDEKSSIPYATLLAQKGFDNIFLLNGGIEEFSRNFPEYLEGPQAQQFINAKLQEENEKKKGKKSLISVNLKSTKTGKTQNTAICLSAKSGALKSSRASLTSTNTNANNLKSNLQKK